MTERSRPHPLPHLRFVVLVAVFSMLAASCGLSRDSAGGTAATITFEDGTTAEVSSDVVDEYYTTLEDDIDFVAGAFGEGGIPDGFEASIVSDLIIGAIFDDLLDENDAEVAEEDIEAGEEALQVSIASFFPLDDDPMATAEARFDTLPYLPFLASLQAKQAALGDALSTSEGDPETIEVPCSSHILLETEDEALEVVALLEDGGDFAELAMEFSTGPTGPDGGDLGCSDPSGFVAEFRDAIVGAPIDTIIGPVQTEFGFHVITVTAIEEQAVVGVDPTSLVTNELISTLSQIEVDVAPQYGEWDEVQGAVVPN